MIDGKLWRRNPPMKTETITSKPLKTAHIPKRSKGKRAVKCVHEMVSITKRITNVSQEKEPTNF